MNAREEKLLTVTHIEILNKCSRNYCGSPGGMEGVGLIQLSKKMYHKNACHIKC